MNDRDTTSQAATTAPDYGMAATGSPLYAATIGAEDIDRSIAFYRDEMGFDVLGRRHMAGLAFETHWGLPGGTTAEVAVLADRECIAGRVVLAQFGMSGRQRVRNIVGQRFFGLVNLNFYSDDIRAQTARLESRGCRAWSEPVIHEMGAAVGEPIEVMLDGPDSVILNLIQLQARAPQARILRTMQWIADSGGYNRCGTTSVATSQHCVSDYAKAMAFNTTVMGMSIRNDVELAGAEMERFMQYPPGARTRDTYLQGTHVFGKIAINHPLNFECENLVPRAVAPNIGYLAQSFLVPDLTASLSAARGLGAEAFSPAVELELPGLGRTITALVRNPGSGALHELIQTS
jgi:catechol 2,3-dioxygenase-like lactoylglutathione lyase family enzyme